MRARNTAVVITNALITRSRSKYVTTVPTDSPCIKVWGEREADHIASHGGEHDMTYEGNEQVVVGRSVMSLNDEGNQSHYCPHQ